MAPNAPFHSPKRKVIVAVEQNYSRDPTLTGRENKKQPCHNKMKENENTKTNTNKNKNKNLMTNMNMNAKRNVDEGYSHPCFGTPMPLMSLLATKKTTYKRS
ncbi:unnamed protein product [Prunus armeniaca]|uniref:Uncharacterized protein n=1 Tax=Prunus armeniaca TaxID=36596 RepID=A0A6J5VET9_PRUAR|nr:unnamed protein product [Prunus armeniaca]